METPNKESLETSLQQAIQQAIKLIPDDMTHIREEIEKNLRAVLESGLQKMDLVSRQEFDIQSKLLSRTRELVDELEKKIAALEEKKSGN